MGKIIKDGVEHFFFGGGSGSGDNIEIMTRAEYDALVEAGTVDADVVYFITDAGSGSTGNASDVVYDNTESGLTATDVQGAVDELNKNISALNSSGAITGMSAGEDGVYITYVPSAGADPVTKKLGEAEMVLLWTNPNSASSKFAGQTVSVDLSDYTYVVITQYASDQLTYTSDVIIPVGSTGNSGGVYNRTIKVTTSGITFSNAANGTYPTAYNIPRYIYGLG